MATSKKILKTRLLIITIAVSAIGLSCLCNGSTVATPSPTVSVPKVSTPVPEVPTPQIVQGLNPQGPWLLISTDQGLWAGNPDGSNLTQLTQGEFWQAGLARAIQPGGNRVVLLTSEGDRYHHLALNLLSLPDGRIQKITDLTIPQTEPGAGAAPGDTVLEAVRAIAENPSFAWSPDGTKLAFIGVLDGPTADLYLYDTNTYQITRVSQDDAQNFWPSWSPDGRYILFFGADGFGSGAGMAMKGVWRAYGDGSNVTWLYETTSSGEELVGWWDNETAVLDTWSPVCGSSQLRLFNIVNMDESILADGCFNGAAVGMLGDGSTGTVLFGTQEGLFRFNAADSQPVKISNNPVVSVEWEQSAWMFIVHSVDGSLVTYYGVELKTEVAPAQAQDVTMFGLIWAWTSNGEQPGVWISGPGIDIGQISSNPAFAPIWNEKDNTLFFFSLSESGTDLYRSTFGNYYNDTGWAGSIPAGVLDVEWVGSFW